MGKESTNEHEPSGTMSNNLIQALIDNYRNNHLNAINETLGITDAHSIWFDLPKLKNFIATIEKEASVMNPETTENDLGIRFYYAAYPKSENWEIMASHPVAKEYAEKHTLVMVPTLKKEDENGEIHDCDFKPISAVDGESRSIALNRMQRSDENSIAENQGFLIPPGNSFAEGF
ncbi:hypothetical protein [Chryseobacterium sp.]|uniref:hypothetical protein n=1 Tax=Chryseobacterium sp. TaxID=1871047 RepID=UPI0025B801A7|nr:hypothetical protein [Chryseobacterium sp.]MBV8326077.1 hypothetical protein [Chryseobacterium sp.]